MKLKSEEQLKIEELAKQMGKQDKRLSWETRLKRARAQLRLFNTGIAKVS